MVPEPEMVSTPEMRPDEDIRADTWDAFWRDDQIRVLERGNIEVQVLSGEVTLRGHAASSLLCEAAEEIAATVPGVRGVTNRLVADADLEVSLSRALADDPRTRSLSLRVNAYHGWVMLSGEVPSAELRAAVESLAVQVRGVRGILGLPAISGSATAELRRALQPEVGAAVYAADGRAGRVVFVVIDPRTRLVIEIGMRADFDLGSRPVTGGLLVPAEALDVISAGSVFLTDALQQLAARPIVEDNPRPAPPDTWEPPFPYLLAQVRWPSAVD